MQVSLRFIVRPLHSFTFQPLSLALLGVGCLPFHKHNMTNCESDHVEVRRPGDPHRSRLGDGIFNETDDDDADPAASRAESTSRLGSPRSSPLPVVNTGVTKSCSG